MIVSVAWLIPGKLMTAKQIFQVSRVSSKSPLCLNKPEPKFKPPKYQGTIQWLYPWPDGLIPTGLCQLVNTSSSWSSFRGSTSNPPKFHSPIQCMYPCPGSLVPTILHQPELKFQVPGGGSKKFTLAQYTDSQSTVYKKIHFRVNLSMFQPGMKK